VAEQLYDALLTWKSTGAIDVTSISLDFFRQFAPSISPGTYRSNSPEFPQLTSAVKTFADGFVKIAAKYTPSDGGLAEQFNKNTGLPASAADLTWSYASVLTAAAARAGTIPASWGANDLIVPTTCVPYGRLQIFVTFNLTTITQLGGTFDLRTHYCTSFIPTSDCVRRNHIPRWFH
jgi:glucoamylase